MKKRLLALLLIVSSILGLAACGGTASPDEAGQEEKELIVRAAVCKRQIMLDPAHLSDVGGQMIVGHLFENLLRWELDEEGQLVLAPGQAESYTVEESYDGSVTYTFTIREGLEWSDGKAVTAVDFLYAWKRLFDQDNIAKGITGLFCLRGYTEAYNTGDLTNLGVAAPDRYTFIITLDKPCAYFLEEFCAGAMTMPVPERAAKRSDWGTKAAKLVCNGPYTLERLDDKSAVLVKNEAYYDLDSIGPQQLEFVWEGTYEDYAAGELDLIADLSRTQAAEEATCETLPVATTCTLLLNNEAEPFDNEFVRQALAAALDKDAVLAATGSTTETVATGMVPTGVRERGAVPEKKEPEPEPVGLPNAVPEPEEETEEPAWDFRSVGDSNRQEEAQLTTEERYEEARNLLAQAGYPDGRGFPEIEYLYVSTVQNRLAAEELQRQWKGVLNIDIAIRGMEEDELRPLLLEGAYSCASFDITSTWNDASFFLSRWMTGKAGNLVRNNNRGFDLLNDIAAMTVDTAAREAYLHDAEEILLRSCGVIPLYFYGRTYALAEDLQGLGTLSTGKFFLQYLERVPVSAPAA